MSSGNGYSVGNRLQMTPWALMATYDVEDQIFTLEDSYDETNSFPEVEKTAAQVEILCPATPGLYNYVSLCPHTGNDDDDIYSRMPESPREGQTIVPFTSSLTVEPSFNIFDEPSPFDDSWRNEGEKLTEEHLLPSSSGTSLDIMPTVSSAEKKIVATTYVHPSLPRKPNEPLILETTVDKLQVQKLFEISSKKHEISWTKGRDHRICSKKYFSVLTKKRILPERNEILWTKGGRPCSKKIFSVWTKNNDSRVKESTLN